MKATLGAVAIQARRSPAVWASLLVPAVVFAAYRSNSPDAPRMWVQWDHAVQFSVLLLAPLVAGLTAYRFTNSARHSELHLLNTSVRSSWATAGMLLASDLVLVVLSYLVGAGLLAIWVSIGASWGGPNLASVLSGAAFLAAAAALGSAVASVVRSYVVVPLVAIAFWALLLTWPDGAFRASSPFTSGLPGTFLEFPSDSALLRSGLYAFIAVIIMSITVSAVSPYPPRHYMRHVLTAIVGGVVIASVLVRVAPDPAIIVDRAERICKQGAIETCVHPAWVEVEEVFHDVATTVMEPVIEELGLDVTVVQSLSLSAERRLVAESGNLGNIPISYEPGPSGFSEGQLARSIASHLSAGAFCPPEAGAGLRFRRSVERSLLTDSPYEIMDGTPFDPLEMSDVIEFLRGTWPGQGINCGWVPPALEP